MHAKCEHISKASLDGDDEFMGFAATFKTTKNTFIDLYAYLQCLFCFCFCMAISRSFFLCVCVFYAPLIGSGELNSSAVNQEVR